jgi:hypothetical protein
MKLNKMMIKVLNLASLTQRWGGMGLNPRKERQ